MENNRDGVQGISVTMRAKEATAYLGIVGVLEHVLSYDRDEAKLIRDPVGERQKRLKEKEEKYADIYLS